MMRSIIVCLFIVTAANTKSIHKRNNEYGDEPVAPAAGQEGGYGEEEAAVVPAPEEEAPNQVE
ncbi:unnamed protein product, partial [Anisakis simplex]|uniref:Secreted protein n=1 Tax=Anisakis simplex TaxID=6269 RepID=A0A0M3JE20_ANISI